MDKFCNMCGTELGENGLCPNCSAEKAEAREPIENTTENITEEVAESVETVETVETAVAEQAAEEPVTETGEQLNPEELLERQFAEFNKPSDEDGSEAEVVYEPDSEPVYSVPEQPQPQPVVQQVQPSKFYFTLKQFGNIVKLFFSRHTADAIAAQFNEPLPVWLLLMPLNALVVAVSSTLSFDSSRGLSIGVGSLFNGMTMSYFEVFLVSLAVGISIQLAFSYSLMVFFKSLKSTAKFRQAANLVTSSYIAVSVISLVNILTVGTFMSEYSMITSFGIVAFGILLYLGVSKGLGGKRPFWSFVLMITCAFVASLIFAMIISSPIVVMRALESLAHSVR